MENIVIDDEVLKFKSELKSKYAHMDYKEYLNNIQWEDDEELIARNWQDFLKKTYDTESLHFIKLEIPDLKAFLRENKGNAHQAFKERIKPLNLETKRWI